MTWKIRKNTKMTGELPVLWLHDPKVDLHLVTELDTGVSHLFIGSEDRNQARLYITFADPDDRPNVDGAVLEGGDCPTVFDLKVISSVLRTMNYSDDEIIGHLWKRARELENQT